MEGLADFLDDLLGSAELVALAIGVGGLVWGAVVLRGWRPGLGAGEAAATRLCLRLSLGGAAGLLAARFADLTVKAWLLTMTLGRWPFPAFLQAPLVVAGTLQAVLAALQVAALLWLERKPDAPLRWGVTGSLAVALLINGAWLAHAVSRLEYRAALMTLTALHESAAAVWVGGVLQMVTLWRGRERIPELRAWWPCWLRRFAIPGAAAVVVLIGTGGLLGTAYVGSWRGLIGTSYGAVLITKLALLATALAYAALNHRSARRETGAPGAPVYRRTPYLVEVEAVTLTLIVLAASTLSSQPPAIDTPDQTASPAEVARVFTPKWPRLASPPHSAVNVSVDWMPETPEQASAGQRWSEFNHNVSGLILVAMALLSLLAGTRFAPIARLWPWGFALLGLFVLIRSDAETWPLGPVPFFSRLGDAEVLQHRIAVLLVFAIALIEFRARAPRNAGSRLAYLFPWLCLVGGGLLLTHNHSGFQLKSQYLTQISHTAMALFAILLGCGRWLELRLDGGTAVWAGRVASGALLMIGLLLVFYRELPG